MENKQFKKQLVDYITSEKIMVVRLEIENEQEELPSINGVRRFGLNGKITITITVLDLKMAAEFQKTIYTP